DVNECTTGGANCSANGVCANTPGGFTCACKPGYAGNGVTCTDVNECANNPCDSHATCSNLDGSFRCACNQGYTGNGVTCTDVNECTNNPCDAHAVCLNS